MKNDIRRFIQDQEAILFSQKYDSNAFVRAVRTWRQDYYYTECDYRPSHEADKTVEQACLISTKPRSEALKVLGSTCGIESINELVLDIAYPESNITEIDPRFEVDAIVEQENKTVFERSIDYGVKDKGFDILIDDTNLYPLRKVFPDSRGFELNESNVLKEGFYFDAARRAIRFLKNAHALQLPASVNLEMFASEMTHMTYHCTMNEWMWDMLCRARSVLTPERIYIEKSKVQALGNQDPFCVTVRCEGNVVNQTSGQIVPGIAKIRLDFATTRFNDVHDWVVNAIDIFQPPF